MAEIQNNYDRQVAEINERAAEFRRVLVNPQVDHETSTFITDAATRNERIAAACRDSIFDAAGESAEMIAGVAANAVRAYEKQRGHLPSNEMMASAMHTIENMLAPKDAGLQGIMDSAVSNSPGAMNSSEGLIKRNHQVALVVPTLLMSITADMVTHIPANYDKSEIFRVHRTAGSTFGDLTKGDIIDVDFMGQYSAMDQRHVLGIGDGTIKRFEFNIADVFGRAAPVRKECVRILADRSYAAQDTGRGQLVGAYNVGSSTITVSGTVDYDKGIIIADFTTAPAAGVELHVAIDIDIEKEPELIPLIDHKMESWTLYPHESALACSASIQAVFGARREFNMDLTALQLGNARNLLAAEKDRKRLQDMYFYSSSTYEWDRTIPTALGFRDHYESVSETLENISMEMMIETRTTGLVGMVAGPKAAALLKSLGAPHFIKAQGYKHIPQPHYVGKLFGFDFKEDPFAADPWGILCYGKGRNHGDAGYVAADAISAVNYAHTITKSLRHENTLYELAYRDLHPYKGRQYFRTLRLIASANGQARLVEV